MNASGMCTKRTLPILQVSLVPDVSKVHQANRLMRQTRMEAYELSSLSCVAQLYTCKQQPHAKPLSMPSEGLTANKMLDWVDTVGSACRCVDQQTITQYQVHQACICAQDSTRAVFEPPACRCVHQVTLLKYQAHQEHICTQDSTRAAFEDMCMLMRASAHDSTVSSQSHMRQHPRMHLSCLVCFFVHS